jgi:tRNA-uridine 2-sulfurtransferase
MEKQKTVVVGLSGGVDSAVAALLLKREGYNVIGAFMKNFSQTKNPFTGECNWVEEKKMAQRVAVHLGIKFVMFDFEKEYTNWIIKEMYKSYSKGLTPNPDVTCNTLIKFPLFWKEAKKLGVDYIAMGALCFIEEGKERF